MWEHGSSLFQDVKTEIMCVPTELLLLTISKTSLL